jgi:hypothetical protein
MSIFTKLFELIKTILPFLKSAAQKGYDALPEEAQQQLQAVSKVVESVKQLILAGKDINADAIAVATGVANGDVESYLISYAKSQGVNTDTLEGAVAYIKTQVANANDTGLKSLWTSMFHTISEEFSHIDWRTLLYGVGQLVFDEYVKGKIKI